MDHDNDTVSVQLETVGAEAEILVDVESLVLKSLGGGNFVTNGQRNPPMRNGGPD